MPNRVHLIEPRDRSGLAHRLASRNADIVSSNVAGDRTTTAFLICEACGDVNEIASPDVADTVTRVLREQGYQPRSRILEITGRCGHCRDVPSASCGPGSDAPAKSQPREGASDLTPKVGPLLGPML